jgi:hypothetical protein
MGMTLELPSITWVTKISCTRFAILKWLLIASRISGRTDNLTLRSSVPFELEFSDIESKRGVAVGWFEIDDVELHAEREF